MSLCLKCNKFEFISRFAIVKLIIELCTMNILHTWTVGENVIRNMISNNSLLSDSFCFHFALFFECSLTEFQWETIESIFFFWIKIVFIVWTGKYHFQIEKKRLPNHKPQRLQCKMISSNKFFNKNHYNRLSQVTVNGKQDLTYNVTEIDWLHMVWSIINHYMNEVEWLSMTG